MHSWIKGFFIFFLPTTFFEIAVYGGGRCCEATVFLHNILLLHRSRMIKGVVSQFLCVALKPWRHIAVKEKPKLMINCVFFDNVAFPLQAF